MSYSANSGTLFLVFTIFICLTPNRSDSKSLPSDCTDLQVQILQKDPKALASLGEVQQVYLERENGELQKVAVPASSIFSVIFSGPEPLSWSYDGPGEPTLTETIERSPTGCHIIKLNKPKGMTLESGNTGRYTVRYATKPEEKSASVYLYAANKYPPYLMNAGRLQSRMWQEGKPLVLPCLLNEPTMKVSFSKRVGLNEWREVTHPGAHEFDPKVGFTLRKPLFGASTLLGSYKCFTKLHNRNDTVFINVLPEGAEY